MAVANLYETPDAFGGGIALARAGEMAVEIPDHGLNGEEVAKPLVDDISSRESQSKLVMIIAL